MIVNLLGALAGLITAIGVVIIRVLIHKHRMAELELTHKQKIAEMDLSESKMIRDELRFELDRSSVLIKELSVKLDKLSTDLDNWKMKYFSLQEQSNQAIFDLRTELQNKVH